jgi:hypothetical protein
MKNSSWKVVKLNWQGDGVFAKIKIW